jgi:hypothetical protein
MQVSAKRIATSLEAIRASGGHVSNVLDAWETPLGDQVQVFVSVGGASTLRSGEQYDTWVVTLGRDGSPTRVEQFPSTACQTRGSG